MKPIAGFPGYTIDELGVVRRGEAIVSVQVRYGYVRVRMWSDDRRRLWRHVAALVLEAYVGPRPSPKHEAAHLDGERTNNRLGNLVWKTREENEADKKAHGSASRCGGVRTQVNRHKARRLRLAAANDRSICDLAKAFRVHRRTVARIIRGAA